MFVSVIVPTYKDVQALELILDALKLQTYKKFEVVIAEDDESIEVKELLKSYVSEYEIKHFSHKDDGYQKAKALNGAIKLSSGNYLIFFDGDCLPYSGFIKAHVESADENKVLCGRRVNLGDKISSDLRERNLSIEDIEHHFFRYYFKMKRDGARHLECGMKIIAFIQVHKLLKKTIALIGCNFSLYKDKILLVNGFDESYPKNTTLADDVDLEWRLQAIGLRVESVKYTAHLLHLNHSRADRVFSNIENIKKMNRNKVDNKYYCDEGLEKR